MSRYGWKDLSPLQLGAYAEYFVKMEMIMQGVDIYSPEIDDRGIDFVARTKSGRYFEVQVKSVYKAEYVFMPKQLFQPRPSLLLALVAFEEGKEPLLHLLRSTEWLDIRGCFRSYDYVGKKSDPEWGLMLSRKHLEYLKNHLFHSVSSTILNEEWTA